MILLCHVGNQKDTPQKSKIDTQTWPYFEGVTFFQTMILDIHVSFRGCSHFKVSCYIFGRVKAEAQVSYTLLSKSLLRGVPWRKPGVFVSCGNWQSFLIEGGVKENKSSAPLHFDFFSFLS